MKKKLTVNIDVELLETARATAYWCRFSLSDLVAASIEKEVARLQAKQNAGKPFKSKGVTLRRGRPLGG